MKVDWTCDPWPEREECRDFCRELLSFSPAKRPTSAWQALSHPWLLEHKEVTGVVLPPLAPPATGHVPRCSPSPRSSLSLQHAIDGQHSPSTCASPREAEAVAKWQCDSSNDCLHTERERETAFGYVPPLPPPLPSDTSRIRYNRARSCHLASRRRFPHQSVMPLRIQSSRIPSPIEVKVRAPSVPRGDRAKRWHHRDVWEVEHAPMDCQTLDQQRCKCGSASSNTSAGSTSASSRSTAISFRELSYSAP